MVPGMRSMICVDFALRKRELPLCVTRVPRTKLDPKATITGQALVGHSQQLIEGTEGLCQDEWLASSR